MNVFIIADKFVAGNYVFALYERLYDAIGEYNVH